MLLQIAAGGAAFPAAAQSPLPRVAPAPIRRAASGITAETSAYSVVLTAVATDYEGVTGLTAYEPANELAIAGASAGHDFELVASDGLRRPFSAANGIADGARIATARADGGTFRAGDLFAPAGNRIVRVSADGATVQSAWVTLPGESSISALTVDRTGAFGGDVIAVTAAGNVWRVNGAAAATLVASVGTSLGSVTTLANDPGRHGPWAGCIVAGAETQPLLYAIAANGTIAPLQTSVVPHDLAVVTAHENFFGLDGADRKVWAAPSSAFAGMIGDVVVAQGAPGVLARIHWNGSAFESSELARVAEWRQIVFSAAGVGAIHTARRPYDRIAVVRHAPLLSSGRIEGALWQLSPESVTLDGSDVITSDLLVPGMPQVATSGNPAFGGTVEGDGQQTPSSYTVSITGKATLGHLITRTDAMTLAPVAAFTPTTNTRDVSLTSASGSAGDFATLRDLSLAGQAGAVAVPPGRYGRFTASGRTAFVLGSAGATQPAAYELDSLNLSGGTELRVAGPVVLTVNNGAVLTGATIGAAEEPRNLVLRVAVGGLRIDGRSVLYAIVRAPQSTVTIDGGGRLRGTVSCDRLDLSGVVQLTETDIPPPPVNRPPAVDAGADASVTLPESATLLGSVADDGLPGSSLTSTWARVTGPAEVTFADPHAASTAATFTAPGAYVLRLTANDGELASSDDVTITVKPRNQAPVVNAGADQSIELPAAATVSGSFTDDGLPQSTVTTQWTFVSGPGAVAFADAGAPVTTATFSVAGTYVLRLTADDGELSSSDEVTVTAAPENQAPVVNAGADQFVELPQPASLAGTATDDGLPDGSSLTKSWTLASGPGEVTFADATQLATTATFTQPGTYVLRLTATDGRFSISDDLTVTVDPANAAPTVDAGADQTIELPAPATLTATVHDADPVTVQWTRLSGPAEVVFSAETEMTTSITFTTDGVYTFRITASDGHLSASDDVIVTVLAQNQPPAVDAGADQLVRLPAGAVLNASASDDGNPAGAALTVRWTKGSGAGEVTFANATARQTQATFSAPGVYVLRITADDSKLQVSDDVTITVLSANSAPIVSAGPDLAVALPATAALSGTATDDGAPSPLTYAWTTVSGPANVAFATPLQAATTASFAGPGTFVLRLTVSDGEFSSSDDVTVVVTAANTAPVVDAGADLRVNVGDVAPLSGQVTDDALPSGSTLAVHWTTLSGPAVPAFADANAAQTTATFAVTGIYVLRLTATDGALSASDDVTVAVVRPPVADFTVPAISRNVARWKNNLASTLSGATIVSETSNDSSNVGALMIDDSPYTRWRSGSGQTQNQSLVIRLGGDGTRPFDRIRITNDQSATEAVRNFRFEISTTTADATAFTTVLASFLDTNRGIQEFPLDAPLTARYARFVFLDNYGATNMAIRDVEVIATGGPGVDRVLPINVADSGQSATVVASSPFFRNPSQALDGNLATWWQATTVANAFMTVRLVQEARIDRVRLVSGSTDGARPRDFTIEVATDMSGPYTKVLTATLANQDGWQEFALPGGAVRARFVRLTVVNNYGSTSAIVLNDFAVLSADRPSVSSMQSPYERPELAFDNNNQTSWTTTPGHVAGEFFIVHLTDDEPRLIDAVELQGIPTSAVNCVKDFDVLVSTTTDEDSAFQRVVSGTVDPQTNLMQRFDFPAGPTRARYVKLLVKSNNGGGYVMVPTFHVLTLEQGGNLVTVPTPWTRPVNLSPALVANGATVVASTGSNAASMLDYVSNSGWITSGLTNQFATIALGGDTTRSVSGVRIAPPTTSSGAVQNFEVWVSSTTADDSAFTKVLSGAVTTELKIQNFFFPGGAVPVRYVKYVPLTRFGTATTIQTNVFDVILPVHPGGAVGASSTSGYFFPEGATSAAQNVNPWVSLTGSNEWLTVALPGSATRSVYGVTVEPSSFAPKDFDILVSNTTSDDAAFTKVYSGTYSSSQKTHRFGRAFDARYVRFYFKTGTPAGAQFNIGRVDVLTVPETGGAVLGASSGLADNADPTLAIDVNPAAGAWAPESFKTTDQTFTVALPGAKLWRIDHVALQQGTACCPYLAPRDFEIQVSAGDLSDASYVTVYRGTVTPDFSPEHCFFPAVSARAVRLLVRNNWGGNAFVVQNFWVFSPQVGPRTARFLDTSVPGARTIVAWSWSFGDGATSSDRDPVHAFPGAGTYEVALTVTDSDGLTTRRGMQYTVFGDPNVDFTVSPVSPAEVSTAFFTDTSTSPSGAIATSDWTFGDASSPQLNVKSVSHTYLDSGDYVVRHTVSDIRGVTATASRTLKVTNVPPTVSAGPDLSVPWNEPWGATPLVGDISAIDRTSITCHWDFGDGTSTDVTNCVQTAAAVHRYATAGTFTATLTATDKDGGSASDTVVTTVTRRASMVTYGGARGVAVDGSIALSAVLRDRVSGEPLAGPITFGIDGQIVTAAADATGRASASFLYTGTALEPVVTVTYAGDARYLGNTSTAKLSCPASQQPLDVALVVDLSASMDVVLTDVKAGFTKLIDSLTPGKDRVAMISFVNGSHVWQTLAGDLELARKSMEGFTTTGGAGIDIGISTGTAQLTSPLRNPAARPVMVVLSDGIDNPPTAAANDAKSKGITLISVMWTHSSPSGYDTMFPIASSPSDFYEVTSSAGLEPLFMALPGTLCVAANTAPVPSAGATQTIALPQTTVTLTGSVFDDGKPAGSVVTTNWTKQSGPGEITFGSATERQTTATMTVPGTYVARLTAFDGELYGYADVAVVVKPENQPPIADAGPDLTTTMEAELLKNGGAEEPLVNGKLPSWTEMAGTWTATTSGPQPMRGTHTFVSSGATAAELIQDVDVSALYPTIDSGTQTIELNAFVRVGDETPADAAKIMIEYLSVNNGSQLRLTQSSDIITSHLWERVNITEVPPPGTRVIRIHLIAARHSGATNDVWFDAVSLRALGSATAAIQGQVTDDAQPSNFLHTTWTQTAGPVTALIGDSTRPKALITTRVPGTYTFRMTADDSAKTASDDMSVTTLAGNAVPVVNAGANATVTLPSAGTLAATATDENPSTLAWSWYQLSGPDAVIAQPHAATTEVAFSTEGSYLFRAYADDGDRIGVAEVTVTVNPSPGNHAPVVNAGPDLIVTDPPRSATLTGTVTDDGLPEGEALTYAWTSVSGPAAAQFETATQRTTNVYFPSTGTYTLRLSSSDTRLIGSDDLVVNVVTNKPPAVNAGDDVIFTDSQPIPRLAGQATDGEIPPGGALTYQWTRLSGPGNVTFATPTQLATSITLSAHGRYVFRLTATDSQLSASDDVAITWDGANSAPTVNAGADLTVTLPATAALDATVDDDGLPVGGALSMGWSRVSGPAEVTFSAPGSVATTATFTVAGDYVLRLTVTDGEATASDDIAVTVKDAVPPPEVEIVSPAPGTTITDRTTIFGTVSSGATWRVEYRLNGNDAAAGAAPWTVIGSGSGAVTNAPVAVFDPTLVLNGSYKIRLVATDGSGQSAVDSIAVIVEGGLKIGLFTLEFDDLDVPLPGIQMKVQRVYDSRDKRSGDFGYGWNVQMRNVRAEESGVLGRLWEQTRSDGSFPTYCISSLAPHFVIITMPDGKVYRFRATPVTQCQQLAPFSTVSLNFVPVGDTRATLTADGTQDAVIRGALPGPIELIGTDVNPIDPSIYRLTTEDGVVFVVDEQAGLRSITDRNANSVTFSEEGITHSTGAKVTFVRDAAHRITSIVDTAGKSLTYEYDGHGDLIRATDPTSRATTFTYNGNHGLLEYFDAANRRAVRSEYDGSGRLIAVTDAKGAITRTDYDPLTRKEVVTDRNGHVRVYEFDARGHTISIGDSGGRSSATYNALGNMTSATDRLDRKTIYTYDERGNMLTITDSDQHTRTFTYNASNLRTSATDPNGHTTTYEYDGNGNLTKLTDPLQRVTTYTRDAHGLLASITGPAGDVRRFEYDARGFLAKEIDPLGNTFVHVHDSMGRRVSYTNARAFTTTFGYDAAGRATSVTDVTGTMTYEYDAAGNDSAQIDARGVRSETGINAAGQVETSKFPDGSVAAASYDAEGSPLTATHTGRDAAAYTRNDAGQITGLTIGGRTLATYELDAEGRRKKVTDGEGRTVRYTFDGADHVTSIAMGSINPHTLVFDGAGNRLSATMPDGKTTTYKYDALDRMVETVRPDAESIGFGWNDYDRVASIAYPNGGTTTLDYDAGRQLRAVTEPIGGVTSYEYDENGNLKTATDAEGRTSRIEYDAADRLAKRIYPDGSTEVTAYDGPVVKSFTDRAGRMTTYEVDGAGRPIVVRYADGRVDTVRYTPLGRPEVLASSDGSVTYQYDGQARVISVVHPDTKSVTYEYDGSGNRTKITTPAGATRYEYSDANRLAAVVDPHGHVTRYVYDSAGRLERTEHPNGFVSGRSYDDLGRLEVLSTVDGSGHVVFSETYERDPKANQTKITYQNGTSVSYEYDLNARLTSETHRQSDGTIARRFTYTYDKVGNRQTFVDSAFAGVREYGYTVNDEMTSDGIRSYTYDALGNTHTATSTAGTATYGYDVSNRLTSFAGPAGSMAISYDAAGNRARVIANGQRRDRIIDDGTGLSRLLAEYDQTAMPVATYVQGALGPVSMQRGGEELVYIEDGTGSVHALADMNGNVTDTYEYSAYGELLSRSGSTENPLLYHGEEFDPVTGLYFLRARYYDPSAGRFLTMDTRAGAPDQPATRHRYIYALNDPIKHIDPCGREAQPIQCQIGNIIDGVIGEWYRLTMTWQCDRIAVDQWLPSGLEMFGVRVPKSKGGLGCRPDIVNFCSGEVFEVKPLGARYLFDAFIEAVKYSMALNMIAVATGYEPNFWPGILFVDPPILAGMEVHGPLFHGILGAIFYSLDWNKAKSKLREEWQEVMAESPEKAPASMIHVQVLLPWAIGLAALMRCNDIALIVVYFGQRMMSLGGLVPA
jgi:RHS repeat-associated protein